jgi:hypothetical protein
VPDPAFAAPFITVYDVLKYLAPGPSEEEIPADFSDLASEDIGPTWPLSPNRLPNAGSCDPSVQGPLEDGRLSLCSLAIDDILRSVYSKVGTEVS